MNDGLLNSIVGHIRGLVKKLLSNSLLWGVN